MRIRELRKGVTFANSTCFAAMIFHETVVSVRYVAKSIALPEGAFVVFTRVTTRRHCRQFFYCKKLKLGLTLPNKFYLDWANTTIANSIEARNLSLNWGRIYDEKLYEIQKNVS